MKRALKVEGTNTELEFSKITAIGVERQFLHFDRLNDGTWRLTYSKNFLTDFTVVQAITLIGLEEKIPKGMKDVSWSLVGADITLPLSKIIPLDSEIQMIHFDCDSLGNWKMLYTKSTLPGLVGWKGLTVIRED
jgi:hypothetical protein